MSAPGADTKRPGWGWPIAAVVAIHLGLAVIPVHISEAKSEPPRSIELSMVALPEPEEPPVAEEVVEEPPPEPEVQEEVEPEPEPPPEPEPVVQADEPEPAPVESEVAVTEEVIEPPEVEEPPPEIEEPEPPEDVDEEVEPDVDREAPPIPFVDSDVASQRSAEPAEPASEPVDWSGYGQGVMRAVQSEREYPRMARRMGWEGTATVRITVDRQGQLVDPPSIVDSTDHDVLDEEVLRMVQAAVPFDGFPMSADDDEKEFVIPVRFRLEG